VISVAEARHLLLAGVEPLPPRGLAIGNACGHVPGEDIAAGSEVFSGGQGSHMLRAMARANALAMLPDGNGVRAGGSVEVMLLDADVPGDVPGDMPGDRPRDLLRDVPGDVR